MALFRSRNIAKLTERRDVVRLTTLLRDSDWEVRRNAAAALGRTGDPRAVEPLSEVLADRSALRDLRRASVFALAEISDPRAVESIIGALKDADREVRRAAAASLGKVGDRRAVAPLMGGVAIEKSAIVDALLGIIDRLRAKEDVGRLTRLLRYDDPLVRREAAQALGEIGDAEAVEPLVRALRPGKTDSPDAARGESNRMAAALVRIGEPAVMPLIGALSAGGLVSESAALALGEIGDVRAVGPLAATLGMVKDDGWVARRNAADALGKIGDARAVEPLVAALEDPNRDVTRSAVVALGSIGDPRAVEPLVRALEDPGVGVRYEAAVALGEIGDAHAVGPLVAALEGPDWGVRRVAIVALCAIGDPRAVEPLARALDPSAFGEVAQEALREMGGPTAEAALAAHRARPR